VIEIAEARRKRRVTMIAPNSFRSHAGSHFHVHPWHAVFVLIVGILLTLVLVVLMPVPSAR
jgi:hypothetical protein